MQANATKIDSKKRQDVMTNDTYRYLICKENKYKTKKGRHYEDLHMECGNFSISGKSKQSGKRTD